ncbi:MAG: BNR-repeat neuraminidase N-terminal domain-containing protein, partial [Bacteroidota bacterium]
MKRSLLSVLAVLLLCALVTGAQAQTIITIGTGTSLDRVPFGMLFGYERCAALYTAAELTMTGNIAALGWDVGGPQTSPATVNIYLKTTTAATLTTDTWANMKAGATLVWSGTGVTFPSAAWQTFTLSPSFAYGADNLLVLVECEFGGSGTGSYPTFRYTTATSQSEKWFADSSPPTGSGTVFGNRPNIQVTFQPTNALDVAASGLVSPGVGGCYGTNQTVALRIRNAGTATLNFVTNPVTVSCSVTGPNPTTFSNVIVSSGSLLPGLTQDVTFSTTYNMSSAGTYVFSGSAVTSPPDSNAGNDNMPNASREVTSAVTLPEAVDFTGFTGANLTTVFPNWKEQAGAVPTGTTSLWNSSTGLGGVGNITAKVNLFVETRREWIVGPKVAVSALTQVKFKVAVTNYNSITDPDVMGSDDSVRVMVSGDCGLTWSSVRAFTRADNLTNTLTEYTVPLTAYVGGHAIVAFYATDGPVNDLEDYDFHIDDIVIEEGTPMSYVSSTVTQASTSAVPSGARDQKIIGIEIVTSGDVSPLAATSFSLSTTGSTSAADIDSAKLYYTGISPVFAAVNQFGATTANPPLGAFTVTGSRLLAGGTNYFWLAYDVDPAATAGDSLDAQCTSVTVGGTPQAPTVTDPAGKRPIRAPLAGTYTIDNSKTGDYASFDLAVADLNLLGISGAVTFSVAAGQTFTDSVVITTSGTASWPIVFQTAGGGPNPLVTRGGTAAANDAVFTLLGADYITFDGIDVGVVPGSTAVEYGYYLTGASGTNGSQHNTVKNSAVTLNKTNTNSRGVYLTSVATAAAGSNSANAFLNNTVQNCYTGYWFSGATAAYDDSNKVGTVASGTSIITNLGGLSTAAYGVYINTQTNLRVFNTLISSISGTGYLAGIYVGGGSVSTAEFDGNLISSLAGTGVNAVYGIYSGFSGSRYDIHHNIITGLSGSSYYVYGIYEGSGAVNIYANRVWDVAYTGTSSTYLAAGIYTAGGTTVNIYNNFLYDIKAPAGTSSTAAASGLYISSGSTVNAYYNSVLLNYTSTGASNTSAAVYVSTTPSSVDLRNNIFVNNTDVTTGLRAVAFRRSATGLTNLASTINNNLYYAGTPPGIKNLIFYDGTNADQTLALYKTRVSPRDQLAVTEMPPFLSTSAPYDLRLNPVTPTRCESGALPVTSPITVGTDIEGNPRDPAIPDIGGDEFAGIAIDETAPVIAYTPLTGSLATPTRTFTAVITDLLSGVHRGSGKPQVYFRKGISGPTSSAAGTEGPTDTWSFTINHTLIGATAVGDTVFYYVAAQDSVPNVATMPPGTLYTPDPPNGFVASPYWYKIAPAFAGAVTIGSPAPGSPALLATFPTVKAFFDSVNASVVAGNITATITSNVTETATAVLNQTAEDGSGSYTITIAPAPGTTDTISGSIAGAIIRLWGADRVTIDGSNSGGTDRNLAILNSSTSSGAAIWISSGGTGLGASSNTVKNCVIACGANQSTGTTETFGIISSGTSISTSSDGEGNDFNTYGNNAVTKVRWGIYVRGSASNPNDGTTVEGNVIGPAESFGSEQIGVGGIAAQYQDDAEITRNEVRYVGGYYANTTSGTDRVGIGLGAGTGWPGAVPTTVTNSSVTRNLVHHIVDERTYSAVGIGVAGSGTPSGNLVANNMVYAISANGTSGDEAAGVCIAGGDGDRVVFNSVRMEGDMDPSAGATAATQSASGIRITTVGVANLTLKNNITAVDVTSNTATLKHYGVIAPSTGYAWGTGGSDNNDYYVNPANTQMVLGGIGTSTPYAGVASLALWKTQFTPAQDAASVSGDPLFAGLADLHITSGSSPASGAGVTIGGVGNDYDGDVRLSPPDIGADEFTGTTVNVSVPLIAGWNMVSNPVTRAAGTDSMKQVFTQSLFAYGF